MALQTFVKDNQLTNPIGRIQVAAGIAYLGQSIQVTAAEQNLLETDGCVFLPGPAFTLGSPSLGTPSFAAAEGVAGNPNGAYFYVVCFKTALGQTIPSAAIKITVVSKKVILTNIPVAPTGTGTQENGVTARVIYRTKAGGTAAEAKLCLEIADNVTTTIEDNVLDGSLGAAVPTEDTSSNAAAIAAALRAFEWHTGP